jgi:adenylate cyclase class 2
MQKASKSHRCEFGVAQLAADPTGLASAAPDKLRELTLGQTQEVEVKYRVGDSGSLARALAERGVCLSAAVHQDDQAYAKKGWTYDLPKVGVPFARLRTQEGQHIFTLKRPMDNEMSCLELETEISDREQMHGAIVEMGFYPTVRIVKRRRWGRLGRYVVCVDEVEQLGTFLEIEAVVGPDQSGAAIQAELDAFARSLSVDLERTAETYDSLVRAALVPA